MTKLDIITEITKQFASEASVYRDLSMTVAELLQRILSEQGIRVHSVTHRSKSSESLSKKIARPDKDYSSLAEITDLAAVRITTYFDDDVDVVARIIEGEFEIDSENSVDKRQSLEADRFGYQSLHFVVSLSNRRSELVEYKRFSGKKLEIQARSILQHAWAEIEHDLGYKSEAGIPKAVRRRFARVAGLLELADAEFSAIREELEKYANHVQENIAKNPEKVDLDLPSLKSAYSTSKALKSLDRAVTKVAFAALNEGNSTVFDRLIEKLNFVGIVTVADLENAAKHNLRNVEIFATKWLEGKHHASLGVGVGVMYLAYVLVGANGDREFVLRYLNESKIGTKDRESIADRIIAICDNLSRGS